MEETKSKVELYENFVNEKLKTDLGRCLQEQEKVYSEIAEYLQVKDTIEKIMLSRKEESASNSTAREPLKMKVDLGCNFYAKAVVDDVSYVHIAIGYGFFLQMKFNEALKFIEKKTKILNRTADELNVKVCEIKANIKFVLEGLREIQNLDPNPRKEFKDIF
jgi:prefoldin subunit 5